LERRTRVKPVHARSEGFEVGRTPGYGTDTDTVARWRKPGQYVCPGEPEEEFTKRMIQFKEWLQGRHESRIAVVAHWGVIYALSGRSMRNCEAAWFSLDDLMRKEILVTD